MTSFASLSRRLSHNQDVANKPKEDIIEVLPANYQTTSYKLQSSKPESYRASFEIFPIELDSPTRTNDKREGNVEMDHLDGTNSPIDPALRGFDFQNKDFLDFKFPDGIEDSSFSVDRSK